MSGGGRFNKKFEGTYSEKQDSSVDATIFLKNFLTTAEALACFFHSLRFSWHCPPTSGQSHFIDLASVFFSPHQSGKLLGLPTACAGCVFF